MHRFRAFWHSTVFLVTSPLLASSGGDLAGNWAAQRGRLLSDGSIVRLDAFQDLSDPEAGIPSLVEAADPLRLESPQGGLPSFQIVEGRWPGKKAIRLNQGCLSAKPFDLPNKAFTASCWFRKLGPGAHRGNDGSTDGTILSVGIGYWDGWRITTTYPAGTVQFEIGRPAPANSVGVKTVVSIPDEAWTHVAATWDGRQMRITVNGLLAAVQDYDGAYTPPDSSGRFKIGYADSGFGSIVMDVDEVVLLKRALSGPEILRLATWDLGLSDKSRQRLGDALAAAEAGLDDEASRLYSHVASSKLAPQGGRALARFGCAALAEKRKDFSSAGQAYGAVVLSERARPSDRQFAAFQILRLCRAGACITLPAPLFERVLNMCELSDEDKVQTRYQLVDSYWRAEAFDKARGEIEKILPCAALKPRQRLDLQFQIGHTYWAEKNHAACRRAYEEIVADPASPAYAKSVAALRIAESFAREGQTDEAETAFKSVSGIQGAPEHHVWEASERVAEMERVRSGLPARTGPNSALPSRVPSAIELFVSPQGSDQAPGTKDHPFASLERARDEIRKIKLARPWPHGGACVHVLPGDFRMERTFELGEEDSGTPEGPVVYEAGPGQKARFLGGMTIQRFGPVRDQAILDRLPPEARDRVVQVDLKAQGISSFPDLMPRGFGGKSVPTLELYFNGKPLTLARWPNEGFVKVGKVHEMGDLAQNRGGTFEYEGDRPERWSHPEDVWMFGYWFFHWADASIGLAQIDPQTHQVRTNQTTGYGIKEGQHYYYFNVLEELDQSGEWFLDRRTGMLYFYPPSNPDQATVELSLLGSPMVRMENVSNVTLRGLTFELGQMDGVHIEAGHDVFLEGCTVLRLAGDAVVIDGGHHHGIRGCDLGVLGRGGAIIKGGDRKTLAPGEHFIENTHVFDFSRIDRTYTPAVLMDGAGNRIAHNLFHNSPHHAIRMEGNDHIVEFNEVHSVVYEADDQAGIDMFYDPGYRGNIIRYNYWHHIGSGLDVAGQAGIRLDDMISGVLIYGNVFYRCSDGNFGGVQIHGGKENIVDNNLFVACKYGVSFSGWGKDRWLSALKRPEIEKKLYEVVDIRKPPYSTKYPALSHLEENPDVNSMWRNLVVDCGSFLTRDQGIQDLLDNCVTEGQVGFLDRAAQDFQLRPDAIALDRLCFRPIPFEEIGLYEDECRASWPVQHEVTEHYRGEK